MSEMEQSIIPSDSPSDSLSYSPSYSPAVSQLRDEVRVFAGLYTNTLVEVLKILQTRERERRSIAEDGTSITVL